MSAVLWWCTPALGLELNSFVNTAFDRVTPAACVRTYVYCIGFVTTSRPSAALTLDLCLTTKLCACDR